MVNKKGFLVTDRSMGVYKTYACANLLALHSLIKHLTGREFDSFPLADDHKRSGLRIIPGILIVDGLHIWD